MEFDFTVDKEAAVAVSHGGGKLGTGLYTVKVEEAYIKNSANGDPMIDLQIRDVDTNAVGFLSNMGIKKTWKSGAENFNYGKTMEIFTAAGVTEVKAAPCKRKIRDVETDAFYIPALKDKVLKLALFERFDVYNNEETVKLDVSAAFLENGKTPKEQEKGLDATVIYKIADRLSPFHTPAWKTWKAAGGSSEAATEATPEKAQAAAADQAANLFT